jgi:hypothetical protein
MSKFASLARFGEVRADGTIIPGSWYSLPPESEFRAQEWIDRAAFLDGLLRGFGLVPNPSNLDQAPKVAVFGSGLGHTAYQLFLRGWSAYGTDGAWAVTRGQGAIPGFSTRIREGDCTSETSMAAFKQDSGIGRNQRFAAGISEDLLSAADDDANASLMLAAMRGVVTSGRMIHLITMFDPSQAWSGSGWTEGLAKSESGWLSLIGTNAERIVNLAGNRIVR